MGATLKDELRIPSENRSSIVDCDHFLIFLYLLLCYYAYLDVTFSSNLSCVLLSLRDGLNSAFIESISASVELRWLSFSYVLLIH